MIYRKNIILTNLDLDYELITALDIKTKDNIIASNDNQNNYDKSQIEYVSGLTKSVIRKLYSKKLRHESGYSEVEFTDLCYLTFFGLLRQKFSGKTIYSFFPSYKKFIEQCYRQGVTYFYLHQSASDSKKTLDCIDRQEILERYAVIQHSSMCHLNIVKIRKEGAICDIQSKKINPQKLIYHRINTTAKSVISVSEYESINPHVVNEAKQVNGVIHHRLILLDLPNLIKYIKLKLEEFDLQKETRSKFSA